MKIRLHRSHVTKRVTGISLEWGNGGVIPPRARFIRLYWQ